ncbi:MAG: enoyl-CoA hydratase/isomerase family protein [Paludibacterium sp.]|uniref:enoyl-CoA hydratase-related protein n=1 Tax=Paludibacterium sp. TaxID=1917523 RepID=UPI0025E243EC|nr:enoyl-CoA hydratase-related protein [Paludibacterium sp.]MBV8047956.1 enoyl-CoA hydratase/isomerase family protein [Paludibacterium sp.]MBV8647233.1 enoyl-CoA hydratase/isomerase family protein [Paludibacterium sp.]
MSQSILLSVDERGVATLTLNRPECHNAIDHDCANLLTAHLQTLADDAEIRAVILTGNGISFSAGHDIAAMRRLAEADEEGIRAIVREYAALLGTLDHYGKPTIARVQGAAFGFGIGLIACCDFAIGVTDALFGFSEVRQGVTTGVAMPYIVRAIGPRAARRYMIGSERFNAGKAKRLGLLHQDVSALLLDRTVEQLVRQLLLNGPQAMRETKRLIHDISHSPLDSQLMARMEESSLLIRTSDEGREGILAFIEHRAPHWAKD